MVYDIQLLQLQIGWIVFAKALLSLQHWLSWKTMQKHSSVLQGSVFYSETVICVLQNKWKIRLQLMKPVTWAPLIWGVLCGAAASGLHFFGFIPFCWRWPPDTHTSSKHELWKLLFCVRVKHPKKSTSFPERFACRVLVLCNRQFLGWWIAHDVYDKI
jgi:hypothetical protein